MMVMIKAVAAVVRGFFLKLVVAAHHMNIAILYARLPGRCVILPSAKDHMRPCGTPKPHIGYGSVRLGPLGHRKSEWL
jgi:hypothetical protein